MANFNGRFRGMGFAALLREFQLSRFINTGTPPTTTRWGPLTTISGFIPSYTHLQPWLNRGYWIFFFQEKIYFRKKSAKSTHQKRLMFFAKKYQYICYFQIKIRCFWMGFVDWKKIKKCQVDSWNPSTKCRAESNTLRPKFCAECVGSSTHHIARTSVKGRP